MPQRHHHKSKPKAGGSAIAHAEAALGAGKSYESPHEGHQKMYSNMTDLEQSNHEKTSQQTKQSRGAKVDQMLAEQDAEEIRQMQRAKEQHKQAHRKHGHH